MKPIDYLIEQERQAYVEGYVEKADLLRQVIELQRRIDELLSELNVLPQD